MTKQDEQRIYSNFGFEANINHFLMTVFGARWSGGGGNEAALTRARKKRAESELPTAEQEALYIMWLLHLPVLPMGANA